MEGSCDGHASLFQGHVSRDVDFTFFVPSLGKSNKRLAAPDCSLPLTVIKRLLLPLALAMFNNYNGRRASRGERGGGGGSRIKLREKERKRKRSMKRERDKEK